MKFCRAWFPYSEESNCRRTSGKAGEFSTFFHFFFSFFCFFLSLLSFPSHVGRSLADGGGCVSLNARGVTRSRRAARNMLFKIKLEEAFVFNFVEIPAVSPSFVLRDSIILRNVCRAISIAKSNVQYGCLVGVLTWKFQNFRAVFSKINLQKKIKLANELIIILICLRQMFFV